MNIILSNPSSPIQCLIQYLDGPNFASLACTCKSADAVRQAFADPQSGFYRYHANRTDVEVRSIRDHYGSVLREYSRRYAGHTTSAHYPIFRSIHRLVETPDETTGETPDETPNEEIRERLELGFYKGPLMTRVELRALFRHTTSTKHSANLSALMIDLEKRMNGCGCGRSNVDRSNVDISNADRSFAMEVAASIVRGLERTVFYGYADETLRVFDRAMDLVQRLE
jgi:hypothetical protein